MILVICQLCFVGLALSTLCLRLVTMASFGVIFCALNWITPLFDHIPQFSHDVWRVVAIPDPSPFQVVQLSLVSAS